MEVVGIFLSPIIRVVIEKLLSPEMTKLITRQRDLHKAIQKLKTTLENINDVLDDAEEKQLSDKAVNKWLKDLHHLAYDAEDLLDEFTTEALRRKLEEEEEEEKEEAEGSSSSKVRIRCLTPTCSTVLSPSTLRFNSKTRSKIEDINEKLQDIATRRTELGLVRKLVGEMPTNIWNRTPATSLMKESRIWGRDADLRQIIELLLGDASTQNKVEVIPIVGMAGIGKTTLAQFVYNDDRVKDHFDLQAWVCVANESGFDVESITKAILESFTRKLCSLRGLNEVQLLLKETLARKKFLLVLDDVWNYRDENWSSLRSPLEAGAHGSKIIVTTRITEVALCMATAVGYYNLKMLSLDDCWEIFAQYAFQNRSIFEHQELESIGKKIAVKCGGLPLAARALGGLLRCKEKEEEWQEVLNSKIWNLPYTESGVLPALKLSYHHLPSPLKRCFQYCAIIPKDYEFEEEELVLLWTAEGIVKDPEGRKQMEDLGFEYFHELVSRSLFQLSSGNKSKFIMHDLINDLAQSVAGDICFRLEDNLEGGRANKISNNARHSSYVAGKYDGIKRFEAFDDARSLRTFIQFSPPSLYSQHTTASLFHDVLLKFKCLHTVRLCRFVIDELPHSIGDLKRLRYLNFSNSEVRRLPDSIGTLYNLEVLLLKYCARLEKLPRNMESLGNLRHFDMTNALYPSSGEMPFQIGALTSLQTLSNFMVGKCNGQRIGELRDLSQLQGKIYISRLENVRNARDASEANLISKKGLKELLLEWDVDHDPSNDRVDMNVLEMLKPHILLERLTIQGYGSTTFPIWVGDAMFYKMESLRLENCKHCTSLPPFGQLPSLKELHIKGLSVLERVGSEFYGKGCPKPFPLLERLSFVDMPEWSEWSNFGTDKEVQPYGQVRELSIQKCPKLVGGLPNDLPCLKSLKIEKCPQLQLVDATRFCFPSLTSLSMEGVSLPSLNPTLLETRNTPELGLLTLVDVSIPDSLCDPSLPDSYVVLGSAMSKHLGSVTELTIHNFGQLMFLPKWFIQGLLRLENLSIEGGKELVTLWQNEATLQNGLPVLRHLEVTLCPQLVSLFEEEEKVEEGEGLGWMPQQRQLPCLMRLENLDIWECEMLKKLPRGLHTLTSLTKLRIHGCPSLVAFPNTGLPPMLREIDIRRCDALQFLPELVTLNNLEVLYVCDCSSLACLCSGGLPSTLKRLEIGKCEKLVSLVAEEGIEIYCPSLEFISIRDCESLKTLPNSVPSSDGCSSLRNLRDLQINMCDSLMNIPEGWFNMMKLSIESCKAQLLPRGDHHQLTSLEELSLCNCPARTVSYFIKEAAGSYYLTNLTRLVIREAELLPSPSEWGLHRLSSLEELVLHGPISMAGPGGRGEDFKSFPEEGMLLPPSLTHLSIHDFRNLEKLSFQNLDFLESLSVHNCGRLGSFPKEGLPPSLLHLQIRDCPKLASFPKQGLPPSLLHFFIRDCPKLASFPNQGLPPSLLHLHIIDCPKLASFPKQGLPPSLLHMKIWNCPKLASFPKQGLPRSLLTLHSYGCPRLKQMCEKGKGQYNLTYIPQKYML